MTILGRIQEFVFCKTRQIVFFLLFFNAHKKCFPLLQILSSSSPSFCIMYTITKEDRRRYLDSLRMTDELYKEAQAVAQRSDRWHWFRAGGPGLATTHDGRPCEPRLVLTRMTASLFGAAAGHNDYKKEGELLRDMLWPSFQGNDATEYGTTMESTAFEMTQVHAIQEYRAAGYDDVWIEETGICVSRQHPWLAASSDGLLYATKRDGCVSGTIEIKCPYARQFYPKTPAYYYDQFQGTAAVLGVRLIHFVIYTPERTQINRYEWDETYWNKTLLPTLRSFYMRQYLPRAIYKDRGQLRPGEIDVVSMIDMPLDLVQLAYNNNDDDKTTMTTKTTIKKKDDDDDDDDDDVAITIQQGVRGTV